MAVISKRFELQQHDCAQIKDLLKQIEELIDFFELSHLKADLWGLIGGRRIGGSSVRNKLQEKFINQ